MNHCVKDINLYRETYKLLFKNRHTRFNIVIFNARLLLLCNGYLSRLEFF